MVFQLIIACWDSSPAYGYLFFANKLPLDKGLDDYEINKN